MSGLKRAALIFVLCIAASILCAYVMLSVGYFWGAKSPEPFWQISIESEVAGGIFGVISCPFVYLATRKRRLSKVAPVIVAIVVAEIIVVSPFVGPYAFVAAVVMLVFALVLCATGRLG